MTSNSAIDFNPCTDTMHKLVHFVCATVACRFAVNDMHDTLTDLRMDNIVCLARRSIACHNPRKCNNQRGNLCPLKRHEPSLRCLRQV